MSLRRAATTRQCEAYEAPETAKAGYHYGLQLAL